LVATNPDASFPAPDGLWPGAGAILAAITTTTRATPTVVGKPARPMFEAAAELTGATHPLVVGDRLDTDIAGAKAMEWDSLLVFSGTSKPGDLPESPVLPTFVAEDVSGLLDDRSPALFRRAKPDDQGAIAALLEEVGLRSEGLPDRIDGTIVTGQNPDGRGVDATACLVTLGDYGMLRSVAVRKPLQGKGLGMLAAAAALKGARAKGIVLVSLFTETAPAFFERLGFRTVDRSQLPEPVRTSPHATEECAETATAMVLELSRRSEAAPPQ
jgi:N-acetylglutamate synthase-like GNAT family acetyltransferase